MIPFILTSNDKMITTVILLSMNILEVLSYSKFFLEFFWKKEMLENALYKEHLHLSHWKNNIFIFMGFLSSSTS